jgi:cbb3-type cytochrome oxidase maturation protein
VSVMPLLVICSILVAGGFLLAFLIATRRGQYDDLGTPAVRMLFDDNEEN